MMVNTVSLYDTVILSDRDYNKDVVIVRGPSFPVFGFCYGKQFRHASRMFLILIQTVDAQFGLEGRGAQTFPGKQL